MRHLVFSVASALLLATFASRAEATPYQLAFSGSGVSGQVTLNYGPATDGRYTQGYEISGISGTFFDSKLGLSNVAITGVEGLNSVAHDPGNMLTPNDFSGYAVANGLPAEAHGNIHYDNLFWPAGSPGVATDYDYGGGVLDIYGLLFDIGNNRVVNLWSNGITPFAPVLTYGVAVVNHDTVLDYVSQDVALAETPEPGTLALLGTGTLALLSRRRLLRKS